MHYWPQLVQLVAVHPLQEFADAEELTVSPPAPLLTKPQTDICRETRELSHEGHVSGS